MPHKEFNFESLEQLVQEAESLGVQLDFSENLDVLKKKVIVDGFTVPNAMAIHPMEGCDGEADGRPGELTRRRYERFSRGGAGLLWFEAVAVVPEGRANPRQLWITGDNISDFQRLVEAIHINNIEAMGKDFNALCIAQLTHSGRYSKPHGKPEPVIACHNKYLDVAHNIDPDMPVIEDGELERLEDAYVQSAVLARKAGFHGVDVKCCHGYLNNELLSAYTREGRYGGSFEGRTRFLFNIVDKIKDRLGKDFIVATRLNAHDAVPYPYGWGMSKEEGQQYDYDMSEPIHLVEKLYEKGVRLVNLTMGNPYYNPHVNRPFDKGPYTPEEHPLTGVARLTRGIGEIQKAVPQMAVVGTGYSWLRQFAVNLAAGTLAKGLASFIGFGREAFAYPDFAKDIMEKDILKKEKCCIACGKCSMIMRAGGTPGCVIRDSKVYAPLFTQNCVKK